MLGQDFSGCYEKYASATGLVKRALELDSSLTNGREIFSRIAEPSVAEVIDAWENEIVYGLVTLVHVFNPPLIVLGGGVMNNPPLLPEVKKRLMERISPGFSSVQLVKAELGNTAGMMGAIYLAEASANAH